MIPLSKVAQIACIVKRKGHDAYRCDKRRENSIPYCKNCKRVGHLARDCQSRGKNNIANKFPEYEILHGGNL